MCYVDNVDAVHTVHTSDIAHTRVTRYDLMSIWEIDTGEPTSMRYR